MVLPTITYKGYDYGSYSGLRSVFWFGRSSCEYIQGVPSLCNPLPSEMKLKEENEKPDNAQIPKVGVNSPWITEEGWHEKLR